MSASKGCGCLEHPKWESVMVPLWMGWWLPNLHLWLHERFADHQFGSKP